MQRSRIIQTRRALGAVHAWVVALRRDLTERHTGLKAELVRLTNALDRISSEDTRVGAACQMLDAHLAAADEALRRDRAWPPSHDGTPASEVKRTLEARRAGLTKVLERERARWAETLTALHEKTQSLGP